MIEKRIHIESAHPLIRMVERRSSYFYEIWSWEIKYKIVPVIPTCMACNQKKGKLRLPLTGLAYTKAELVNLISNEIDLD